MTITLPLAPQEEAMLLAAAQARGVSADVLVREAVKNLLANSPAAFSPDDGLDEVLNSLPRMPSLSDKALSRESMYAPDDAG